MKIVILIGPPLAGKGTVSEKLQDECGFPAISISGLLEAEQKAGTQTGQTISDYKDRGKLVPDNIVCPVTFAAIDKAEQEGEPAVILDGFPRSKGQAEELDRHFGDRIRAGDIELEIFFFEAPETVLDERRRQRIDEFLAQGQQPRGDDLDETVFHDRLTEYHAATEPVKALLDGLGYKVNIVDATGDKKQSYDAVYGALYPSTPPSAPPAPPFSPTPAPGF